MRGLMGDEQIFVFQLSYPKLESNYLEHEEKKQNYF